MVHPGCPLPRAVSPHTSRTFRGSLPAFILFIQTIEIASFRLTLLLDALPTIAKWLIFRPCLS